jgi:hypothetical protein
VVEGSSFTSFLIAVCHSPELLEELHAARDDPDRRISGWDLTPEQLEILRRGDLTEIQAEVRKEHSEARVGFWVSAVMVAAVMSPPPTEPPPPEE